MPRSLTPGMRNALKAVLAYMDSQTVMNSGKLYEEMVNPLGGFTETDLVEAAHWLSEHAYSDLRPDPEPTEGDDATL